MNNYISPQDGLKLISAIKNSLSILKQYEVKGIPTIEPLPSDLLNKKIYGKKDESLYDLEKRLLQENIELDGGIPTITPVPSQLLQKYDKVDGQLIVETIEKKYYGEIMERFHKSKKIETKISLLKNTLSDFLSYEKYIEKRKNSFNDIIRRIRLNLAGCYNSTLNEVDALESEGKKKKAIQKLKLAQTYLLDKDFNINNASQLYQDLDEWIENLSNNTVN